MTTSLGRMPRRPLGVLAAVVLATWMPYAIHGPGWLADDWVYLRNASFNGALRAAGARQVGRPGAELVYALLFGGVGNHPLLVYAILGVIRLAAAVAVFAALADWLGHRVALVAVVIWLLVPNHLSLEQWPSTAPALLALALLATAARGQLRIVRSESPPPVWRYVATGSLLAAACLTYELVVPAAVVVGALPLLRRDRRGLIATMASGIALLGAGTWILIEPRVNTLTGPFSWRDVVPALFGLGLRHASVGARLLAIGLLVLVAVVVWWHVRVSERASSDERPRELPTPTVVGLGLVIIALGIAPLVAFPTRLEGLDDRLNLVSSLGAALVITAVLVTLQRGAAIAVALVVVAVVVPVRLTAATQYHNASVAARNEIATFAHDLDCRSSVIVSGPLRDAGGISGLVDGWNASAGVQLYMRAPDRVVQVRFGNELVGPSPSPSSSPTTARCPGG